MYDARVLVRVMLLCVFAGLTQSGWSYEDVGNRCGCCYEGLGDVFF